MSEENKAEKDKKKGAEAKKDKRHFSTDDSIVRLPTPAKGEQAVYWDRYSSLGLRVSADGAKTFFAMLRVGEKGNKKTKRATVGRYHSKTFPLAEARKVAESYKTDAANHKDPVEEAKKERQEKAEGERREAEEAKRKEEELARAKGESFERVRDEFLKKYCGIEDETAGAKPSAKKAHIPVRPSTAKEYKRILTSSRFSAWEGKPVRTITVEDINEILEALLHGESEKGESPKPIMANRFHSALRKFFYWAKDKKGYITEVPRVPRPLEKEPERERILSDSELVEVWNAAGAREAPFGPLIQLLILTGQRRGEVAGMREPELHGLEGENPLWKIPGDRTKNGEPHNVPLAPKTVAIIKALPRMNIPGKKVKSPLLFTTTGEKPVSGFSNVKEALDKAIQAARDKKAKDAGQETPAESMPAWTMHDLRRTAASGMAGLKVLPHVLEKILNHKDGEISGVAKIYNRHDYGDETRSALNLWASYVDSLVSGKGESNVHYLAASG